MCIIKDLTIEDKKIFEKYYDICKYQNSEANFTNMFMWKEGYNIKYIIENGFLTLCASNKFMGHYHHFPVGKGDLLTTLLNIKNCFNESFGEYRIVPVINQTKQMIEDIFPGKFVFEEKRDYHDYVYIVDELINLSGKKFHAKKNHFNNFVKNYKYKYHVITPDTKMACCDAVCKWIENRNENPHDEIIAVKNIFNYYEQLSVVGAFLEVDGKIVAVTVGEKHHGNALIHIEKADMEYKGVYVAINKLFLENQFSDCKYVNREEDMGLEGLRKAKLSYNPVMLIEKYIATPV